VAAATSGHFGQAAARLNMTQPGLTLRIQTLEKELGVQLLDRNARAVRLTPAGEILMPYATSIIDLEDRALADIKQQVWGKTGRLRISYLTLWDGLPTSIVSAFKQRYPDVTVDTSWGYSESNLDRVFKRDVDLAFLTMASEGEAISVRPIERHELVLVMPSAHRLSAFESVPIKELRGEPMVSVSAGVNGVFARSLITWLAQRIGEQPNLVAFEPPDQIAGAVAHRGDAVGILTEARAVAASNLGVVYRRLEPSPTLEYGAAYRNDNQSPALASLLEIVDELAIPPAKSPAGYESLSTASA
jgi:DNA-binding transcriptional LysR family regulator